MNDNYKKPNNKFSLILRIAAYACYVLAIVFFLMRAAGNNIGSLPIWMIVAGAILSFVSTFVNIKNVSALSNDDSFAETDGKHDNHIDKK